MSILSPRGYSDSVIIDFSCFVLLRGHPTLDRFGEMFDWVAVTFDTADLSEDGRMGPAELLAL